MHLALDELNPQIAGSVRERVRALLDADPGPESRLSVEERHARTLLERARSATFADNELRGWRATGTRPGLISGLAVLGLYLFLYLDGSFWLFALPCATTLFFCARESAPSGGMETWIARRRYSLDELRAVLPLVLHGRTESQYGETLLHLHDAEIPLDETARREILRQINALLDSRLHLETQRNKIRDLLDADALTRLQSERDALEQRLAHVTDAIAAETLRDGLEMCERRLEHARALGPILERLDAQEEVVHQALAAVESALTRLQAASATRTAFRVTDIQETVRRIDTQTRAVEQAVEEVMTLRGRI